MSFFIPTLSSLRSTQLSTAPAVSTSHAYLIVWRAICHALTHQRLAGNKTTLKAVQRPMRKDEKEVHEYDIAYGPMQVLREMDLKHPAALLLFELVESHFKAFGMGCTSFLSLVGCFASMTERLRIEGVHPIYMSQALMNVRRICEEEMTGEGEIDQLSHSKRDKNGCVIQLHSLIDSYLAKHPKPPTIPPAQPAPSPLPSFLSFSRHKAETMDDVDWFFEDELDGREQDDAATATPEVVATQSMSSALASSPPITDSSLEGFVKEFGHSLCHGQHMSMDASIAVVLSLLRSQGIRTAEQLHAAIKREQDVTEQWDMYALLNIQTMLGSPIARGVADGVDPSKRCWELMNGMLLDIPPSNLQRIKRVVGELSQNNSSHSAAGGQDRGDTSFSSELAADVGVVLVNGDVSMPVQADSRTVHPGQSLKDIHRIMQRTQVEDYAWLLTLVKRLRSIGVSVVICKGSMNRRIIEHFMSHSIICIESVPVSKMDNLTSLLSISPVCELIETSSAHMCRVRITLQDMGWNPDISHQYAGDVGKDTTNRAKLLLQVVHQPGHSCTPPFLTLLTSHSTALHSRIFVASFRNCLSRLVHALRDGRVTLGAGRTEQCWIDAIEKETQQIEQQLAQASTHADRLAHSLVAHTAVANALRAYVQLIHENASRDNQLLDESASGSNPSTSSLSPPPYDNYASKLSSFRSVIYLCQLFLQLDGILICSNGRTRFRLLHPKSQYLGRDVWLG